MAFSVDERVKKIVSDCLQIPEEKILLTASFTDDLGADSLNFVGLIMALEEEFDIDISDDETEKIKTVGNAIRLISSKEIRQR